MAAGLVASGVLLSALIIVVAYLSLLWLINKDLTLSGMWIIIAITFHITEVSNENRTNDP